MTSTKILVRSKRPTVPGSEPLSPFDQCTVRLYMPVACLFKVDSPELRPKILRSLQAGLSRTIDDANFIAADIVPDPRGKDLMQLEYARDCGVWFHIEEADEVAYDHLFQTRFPLTNEIYERYLPEPKVHNPVRTPVFTAKVTFITGGLVMVISPHHSIMDAQGLGMLVSLWSKHAAAESLGKYVSSRPKLTPQSIEPCLSWGNSSFPKEHFEVYQVPTERGYEAAQNEIMQLALTGQIGKLHKKIKISHWLIPSAAREQMKAAGSPPAPGFPNVTENNIITAAVWQRVSIARQLVAQKVASSSVVTTVNVRRRMEPPLPEEYLRNVVVISRVSARPEELESADAPGGLYHLARKMAESIDYWNSERIWDFASSVESWPQLSGQVFPAMDQDMFVTIPAKMTELFWQSDWGQELSAPKAVRSAVYGYLDGTCIVAPGVEGELDVMLWTTEEALNRLKDDAVWNSWATFLC